MKVQFDSIKKHVFANQKIALAGVSMVLAISIGLMSVANYAFTSHISGQGVNLEQDNIHSEQRSAKEELTALSGEASINQDSVGVASTQLKSEVEQISFINASHMVKDNVILFNSTIHCAQMRINDKHIAYFKTKEDAQHILENLKASYISEKAQVLSVEFLEDVEIEYQDVSLYDFTEYSTVDAVEEYIRLGTDEKREYVIVSGDTVSEIASKHNMKEAEIYAANPELKTQKYLQIDQVLSLVVPVPLINVVSKERVQYTESIPYEVLKENNSKLYKGDKSVKVNGKEGVTEFVAERTMVNGLVQESTIVSEKVVRKPISKVLYVGTKNPPPTIGTGQFARPTPGGYTITSRFGVRRGRSRHTGIDLAMPTGTAVLAADGGVVTFAGYKGTYGRVVIIDHGGRKVSYYAHCSSLLVKPGQKVFKGKKIALSGNTGRSTGPHLHFEIRIGGRPVNPVNYVRL